MRWPEPLTTLQRAELSLAEKLQQITWGLIALICAIGCMGFIMLYSAANGSLDPWAMRQMIRFGFGMIVLLAVALFIALGFEFVNGFHDTANAVATVIYTHSMPAQVAVVWSGVFNFLGVITSAGLVAFTVVSVIDRDGDGSRRQRPSSARTGPGQRS